MTSVGMSGSSLFLMTSTRSFIRVTLYLTLDSTIFDGRSFNVLLVRDVVAIVVSRVVVVLDPRVGQFSTWKSDGKSTWLFWCRIERNISILVRISARWQHVNKNIQRLLLDSFSDIYEWFIFLKPSQRNLLYIKLFLKVWATAHDVLNIWKNKIIHRKYYGKDYTSNENNFSIRCDIKSLIGNFYIRKRQLMLSVKAVLCMILNARADFRAIVNTYDSLQLRYFNFYSKVK